MGMGAILSNCNTNNTWRPFRRDEIRGISWVGELPLAEEVTQLLPSRLPPGGKRKSSEPLFSSSTLRKRLQYSKNSETIYRNSVEKSSFFSACAGPFLSPFSMHTKLFVSSIGRQQGQRKDTPGVLPRKPNAAREITGTNGRLLKDTFSVAPE